MPRPAPALRAGESEVSRLAAYRPDHLLTALPLLVAGLLVARMGELNEFFLSLFNVLPTLLLLLGGAFCVVYGRQRELSLLVVVYLGYFLLDTQTDHFREHGKVREDAALMFHLCSLLLPLLYGLYGPWRRAAGPRRHRPGPGTALPPGPAGLAGGDPLAALAWPVDEPDPAVLPAVPDCWCAAAGAVPAPASSAACRGAAGLVRPAVDA